MKTGRMLLLAGVFAAAQPIGPSAAITVSGEVTDTEGSPVTGAQITFANESIPAQLFSDSTDIDGTYRVSLGAVTAVEQGPMSSLPTAFHLLQNYPNPFNPSTLIPYQVGVAAQVRLRIYNLLGQPIRTLVDEVQPAGWQVVEWDGRGDSGVGVGAGVYVVRMEAEWFAQSRKMVLVDGAGGIGPVSSGPPPQKAVALQPELQDLFTVRITGSDLEPFSRTGIPIRADTTLDFQVVRLPAPAIVVRGQRDLKAGRFARAAEVFRLAAAEATDSSYQVQARYFLGVALVRLDRFDEAIPVFEEVLDLAPQHLKARWNLRSPGGKREETRMPWRSATG